MSSQCSRLQEPLGNARWLARSVACLFGPLWVCLLGSGPAWASAAVRGVEPPIPERKLSSRELGLIINDADPISVVVGEYYRTRRKIPGDNIVHIRIPHPGTDLGAAEFTAIKADVDRKLPTRVQALALAWTQPFRVECMSITSAFAFGFHRERCAEGCQITPSSAYYDSDSRAPFADFALRPTMSLAALDLERARQLIDRGVASDGTHPSGSAYLLETNDPARNARAPLFPPARWLENDHLHVQILHAPALTDRTDVLFYFTGSAEVPGLATNRFLPGALADHLTSYGGVLMDSPQMSSLRWLEAGATASYGAVVEPCAFPAKFPNPAIAMSHVLAGETLIEAYWKSVAMPSQGIFIGEPLAAPFAAPASSAPRR